MTTRTTTAARCCGYQQRACPEPTPGVIVNQTDPQPTPGQVWLSRYTTGMHVAVTEVDGTHARIVPVTVSDGVVTAQTSRGRWSTASQLHRAYRITDHTLQQRHQAAEWPAAADAP